MRGFSKEERVAQSIGKQLSDFSLDLESVGFYLATGLPYIVYRRAEEVLEAAVYNKEITEYNTRGKYYSDKVQ